MRLDPNFEGLHRRHLPEPCTPLLPFVGRQRITKCMHPNPPCAVAHPLADLLRTKAEDGGPIPSPLLSIASLFCALGDDRRLVEPLAMWLGRLYRDGIEATRDETHRRT
ncbi:MAG TPA: hypothetical protein VII68_10100 [Casimicrobiaceae bacterium]|jgi:hypothetical protein